MVTSRWLRVCATAVILGGVSASCSSAEQTNDPFEQLASLGTSEQALTGGCGSGTAALGNVGFPCDPDGTAGPLAECDHMCTLVAGGGGVNVVCQRVTTTGGNDGKLCGSSRGTDCTKQCKGSLCVALTAANGTACNPSSTFGGSHCGGECVSGVCTALPDTARCSETPNNCKLDTCSPTAARTCIGYPVPRGLSCNDSNVCTTGDVCDGMGKCGGTTKACPSSGTPCLVNACDPTTTAGACIAKPQAGATCAFDKCFAGTCSSTGECIKGAAISCDDSDACTTDSCDAMTGCKHEAKTCPANACQIATCDKTSGACGTTPKSCDDGNPCTADSCDATTGCRNTAIPGCTFIPDAGVDTGVVPVMDTGVIMPVDTGVITPTDTGVAPADTGAPVEEDTGSVTPEDTGPGLDSGGVIVSDTGTDGGAGIEETVETSGCGCRTTSSSGSAAYAALSLAALGLVVVRRRRSA